MANNASNSDKIEEIFGAAATERRRKAGNRERSRAFDEAQARKGPPKSTFGGGGPKKPVPGPEHMPIRQAPAPTELPGERYARRSRTVQQASTIGSSGKPSVTRSAVSGAAGGAATGAAVGAVFGGVGAVPGAVIGATLGGAGGAAKGHSAKRAASKARRLELGPGRQLLVAEFLVCMVILALSPLTDKHQSEGAPAFLKRGAAVCATFFILGLIGASGKGPQKIAAGLGGLITLSLLLSDRDVFAALAQKMGASSAEPAGLAFGDAAQDIGNNDITNGQDIAGQGAG